MTNKPPKKRGRPTKAEQIAKLVTEFGIDPDTIDPRRVLASIAADVAAPATARVAAAKALATLSIPPAAPTKPAKKTASKRQPETGEHGDDSADVVDLSTRRALEILKRRT